MNADDPKFAAGDPVTVAESFAAVQRGNGFVLDFSLASLETQVDRLIESPIFRHGGEQAATVEEERNEAALGAYIGETLRMIYGGEWVGSFHPGSPGMNFYTSFVMFGSYRFEPHLFVAYRLTNGGGEGSFRSYLQVLLPRIEARTPGGDPHVG